MACLANKRRTQIRCTHTHAWPRFSKAAANTGDCDFPHPEAPAVGFLPWRQTFFKTSPIKQIEFYIYPISLVVFLKQATLTLKKTEERGPSVGERSHAPPAHPPPAAGGSLGYPGWHLAAGTDAPGHSEAKELRRVAHNSQYSFLSIPIAMEIVSQGSPNFPFINQLGAGFALGCLLHRSIWYYFLYDKLTTAGPVLNC